MAPTDMIILYGGRGEGRGKSWLFSSRFLNQSTLARRAPGTADVQIYWSIGWVLCRCTCAYQELGSELTKQPPPLATPFTRSFQHRAIAPQDT